MTYMISNRALVLHEMIGMLDRDIKDAEERGYDVSAMRAERKRLADECMVYLNNAVKVKRGHEESANINCV